MIIPDTNLLIYAINRHDRSHEKALEWWTSALHGEEAIGICTPAILSFIRISTDSRLFPQAMAVAEAFILVENWLSYPGVQYLEPDSLHLRRVKNLLVDLGTAGNMVSDAQIAAYALQYAVVIYSADSDFKKFPGVKWKNPLLK